MYAFQLPVTPQPVTTAASSLLLLSQEAASHKRPRTHAFHNYMESPHAPGSPDMVPPALGARSSRDEIAESIRTIVHPAADNMIGNEERNIFDPSQPIELTPRAQELMRMPEGAVLRLTQPREPLPRVNAPLQMSVGVPPAAAAVPGPTIKPFSSAQVDGLYHHVQCAAYRSYLASSDCLYMTNVTDPLAIAHMQSAFAANLYDFDHTVESRARVTAAAIAAEPKWVDHAFWVARNFFTEARCPSFSTRAEFVRAFFIISMRLFFVEGGLSRRLAATPNFSSITHNITTAEREPNSRATYADIGNLPTSMPPKTQFCIGVGSASWPEGVRIGDLWDHDICALFVLVPELVTAIVMSPGQHANTSPFRHLLYTNTYWPAVRHANLACVLIDECVRKICKFQTLAYDAQTHSVDTLTTPYWPVVPVPRQKRAGRAEAGSTARGHPYAFNRCRRLDGSEFWLTPFAKWNDTQTKPQLPKLLGQQLAKQTQQERAHINEQFGPAELAQLYPHLYMSSTLRVHTLARYSNTVQVDAVGEFMQHKSSVVNQYLLSVAASRQ